MNNAKIKVIIITVFVLFGASAFSEECRKCEKGSMDCSTGNAGSGQCDWDGGIGCQKGTCGPTAAPLVKPDSCVEDLDPNKKCSLYKNEWMGNLCRQSCNYSVRPMIGCHCKVGTKKPGTAHTEKDVDTCTIGSSS